MKLGRVKSRGVGVCVSSAAKILIFLLKISEQDLSGSWSTGRLGTDLEKEMAKGTKSCIDRKTSAKFIHFRIFLLGHQRGVSLHGEKSMLQTAEHTAR